MVFGIVSPWPHGVKHQIPAIMKMYLNTFFCISFLIAFSHHMA